LLKSCPFL
jgi:hypothetical protein